jgi:predicted RNA-binding protein YlxR (DUF448 family)
MTSERVRRESKNERPRKRPMRSCIACRAVSDKRQLVRIVRTPEDVIHLDPTGKANGRGAYLCPSLECLRQAAKRKSLPRALKRELPPDTLAQLEEEFRNIIEKQP